MARKKHDDLPAVTVPLNGDIIPDGDYAGLRADDVLRALTDSVHEAIGGEGSGVSIEFAGAALDMALGEYLEVVKGINGDRDAKLFGLRFCETALPYASLPVALGTTYEAARKIKGGRK